jgi:O-antigen/teichoic acid export membrane protein
MRRLAGRIRPLAGKVISSLADQATISGTSFAINVLLARWLSKTGYGAFSVCWSFCAIFAAFHNALILEPMTVVGPAEYGPHLSTYFQAVKRLNWFVVLGLGLLAAATGLFYRQAEVKTALFVLAIALPGYLLLLTARRKQYVVSQPARALQISLVYAATLGATLALLRGLGSLSAVTGVVCIGMSLPVALWAQTRDARRQPTSDPPHLELAAVTREHWRYGKWLFASAIVAVGVPDIQTILLSAMVDLKAAGALRALMNFVLPLSQLTTILSIYALPGLARRMKTYGAGLGLRQAIIFPATMIVFALVYLTVLIACGSLLERLLYGGRMAQSLPYLPLLALSAFVLAVGASFTTLIRAAQNSQHQLIAGVSATIVGVSGAVLLLPRYGLEGAIWSMVLANTASSLCIVITYCYMLRKRPSSWSAAWADLFAERTAHSSFSRAAASE